ncbi:WD40 repeat-like protein [Gautieria morchelliformis]|nr:WD40 repeat-like protein [Gautieria morchelliformis]
MKLSNASHRQSTTYNVLAEVKRSSRPEARHMRSKPWQRLAASPNIWTRLERVAVLGEHDSVSSHSGCVNALHWSADGTVLVSAGDDTRVHLWRLDESNASGDYPLTCTAKIHTGHTNNIFNAHILNGSSRIATCAADRQVRVFDVNRGGLSQHSGELSEYEENQACFRIFKCHDGRVKRIITENSPDYFLTVAEDGTVRQHDLRTPHKCSKTNDTCPSPLLALGIELSTIALSPLTPYNFVVAGESPYAYLFDRRQTGRRLREEWGVDCRPDDITSCVRRFGRKTRAETEVNGIEHVTGSRMSQENGHELLLSYSADAVYLYSTRDPPEARSTCQTLLSPNKRRRLDPTSRGSDYSGDIADLPTRDDSMDISHDPHLDDSDNVEDKDPDEGQQIPENLQSPVVYPRRRYLGACNVETVKDVNFVGPGDEYVVSGSDDGNFFIWDKRTGELLDIHEGDGSVVNVIEQHPSLPVLSVSGIDNTVKIFAPTSGSRNSTRMAQRDDIVKSNLNTTQTSLSLSRQPMHLASLFMHYRRTLSRDGSPEDTECVYQ